MDCDLEERTLVYLRLRRAVLKQKDLNVNLILDEVYVEKSVSYNNGHFLGLDTKTVLSIMLKSVAGAYRDIVSMTPISNISADLIYSA